MGNCNRLGVIFLLLFCTLTGWAQNIRVTSLTAITGLTNLGAFKMTNGASNLRVLTSDANGNASWQPPGSVTDTNALARLNGLGTNTTLNGLTVNAGGSSNYGVTYLSVGSGDNPSLVMSNAWGGTGWRRGTLTYTWQFYSKSNAVLTLSDNSVVVNTNLAVQGRTIAFATSNDLVIGTATLPASNLFSGKLTLPVAGLEFAWQQPSVLASNITILPPTNGPSVTATNLTGVYLGNGNIQLIWTPGGGAGAGTVTGGNANQFTLSSTTLNIVDGSLQTNNTFRGALTTLGATATTNAGYLTVGGAQTNKGPVRIDSTLRITGSGALTIDDILSASILGTDSAGLVVPKTIASINGLEKTNGTAYGQHEFFSNLKLWGGLALTPITNATTVVSQVTNAFMRHILSGHTTFTFGGTPLNGASGKVELDNPFGTNITVTWPLSYSTPQAAGITTFTAWSNSITRVTWETIGGSNRVTVAGKEIVENFLNPTAGQIIAFHDPWTKTNVNDQVGAGGALIRFQTNTVTVASHTNLNLISTNHLELGLLATNNSTTGSADIHGYIGSAIARDAEVFAWLVSSNYATSAGSGNVTGSTTSQSGEVPIYGDTSGTRITNSTVLIDGGGGRINAGIFNGTTGILSSAIVTTFYNETLYSSAVANMTLAHVTNRLTLLGLTNNPGALYWQDTNHSFNTQVGILGPPIIASNINLTLFSNFPSATATNLTIIRDGTNAILRLTETPPGGVNDGTGINVLTNGTSAGVQTNYNIIAGTNGGLTVFATNNTGANRVDARFETTRVGVWRSQFIEAGALRPSTTNGATALTTNIAGGADYVTDDVFEFDDTTEQSVEFKWYNRQWNLGNLAAEVLFYSTNVIGTNIYAIKAKSVAANESTSGAWGTGFQSSAASSAVSTTANRLNKTAVISSITVGGTPADGEIVYIHIARKPGDISDNLVGKSRLAGIILHYQERSTELGAP